MAKMILVIEDETAIQNVIRAFLEDAGYTVALASDGLEGIRQFRAHRPDLVLLDLMLPKIDGFAVCEILRGESRVPIIMLTALDDDSSQLKGFDALAEATGAMFGAGDLEYDGTLITSARQEGACRAASSALKEAADALREGQTPDAVLFDVEQAMGQMSDLLGRTTPEDIVDRIFENFCVGK